MGFSDLKAQTYKADLNDWTLKFLKKCGTTAAGPLEFVEGWKESRKKPHRFHPVASELQVLVALTRKKQE